MKTLYLAAILMISGGTFIIFDGDNPLEPTAKDMMSEFYENNRISTVVTLEEFDSKNMDVKNPESFEWLAKNLQSKVVEDRRDLDRYFGTRIVDGEIKSLIEDIKNYKVGKDRELNE